MGYTCPNKSWTGHLSKKTCSIEIWPLSIGARANYNLVNKLEPIGILSRIVGSIWLLVGERKRENKVINQQVLVEN